MIKSKNEKTKTYTINTVSLEDFIFADWKKPNPVRGNKGPEEVRIRIK